MPILPHRCTYPETYSNCRADAIAALFKLRHYPNMIEVHHYKVLDPSTGKWVIPPLKGSAEAIAKLHGEIVGGTKQIVARASLDPNGFYDPMQPRKEPT
jgi:hypothetical protein